MTKPKCKHPETRLIGNKSAPPYSWECLICNETWAGKA